MFKPNIHFLDYAAPEGSFYAQDTEELRDFSVPQRSFLYILANGVNESLPFNPFEEYQNSMPRAVALSLFSDTFYFEFEDILNSSTNDNVRAELRQERIRFLSGQKGDTNDQERLRWEREEAAWQHRQRNGRPVVQEEKTPALESFPVEPDFSMDNEEEGFFPVYDFFASEGDAQTGEMPEWMQEEPAFNPDEYDELIQSAVPDVYDETHLESLNPEQRAAAEINEGFALVVAGPGTGKTKTLVSHVVHLVKNGVPPRRIGLVTFTNKAAKEMRERAEAMYPPASRVWCGTFHSLAFKLLREYNPRLGILTDREMRPALVSHTLNLYGDADKNLKDMLFDSPTRLKQYHETDKEDRSELLNEWKTAAQAKLTDEEQEAFLKDWTQYRAALEKISSTFLDWKIKQHKMEFDDLVPAASRMIQKGEIFGLDEKISFENFNLFDHLCVDEYQDTSSDQAEFVSLLTRKMSNLFIVGDDAQSIYEWRNASADYMLKMAEENPERVFKLETNYRSTSGIVDQINNSLKYISHRIDKTLRPAIDKDTSSLLRGQGEIYRPTVFSSVENQGFFLARAVKDYMDKGGKAADWAFLFRTHKRGGSIPLQHHLRRLQIPFVVVGGSPVHKEFPAVQMISFMQLSLNVKDELPLRTLLESLPGVAEMTGKKISQGFLKWMKAQEKDGQIPRTALLATWMTSPDGRKVIPSRAQKSPYFAVLVDTLSLIDQESSYTIMNISDRWCRLIMEDVQEKQGKKKGVKTESTNISKNVRSQIDEIKKEMKATGNSPDVQTFIDNILMNERQQRAAQDENDMVTLSTVHSAKGLEWPVVCCPDMNEGIFPSGRWKEAIQRRLRKELRNGVFKKQPDKEQELQLMLDCIKSMEKSNSEYFFSALNNSVRTEVFAPEKFFINPHEKLSIPDLYSLAGEGKFSFGSIKQITKLIKLLEKMEVQRCSLSAEETDMITNCCEKVNKLATINKNVCPIELGSIESMRAPLLEALRPVSTEVSFSPPMRLFFEEQFEKMLDEERRLFYVMISRAMKTLLFTRPGEFFSHESGYSYLQESCYLNVLGTQNAPEYPVFKELRKKFNEGEYIAPFNPSVISNAMKDTLPSVLDFKNTFESLSKKEESPPDEKELFGQAVSHNKFPKQ